MQAARPTQRERSQPARGGARSESSARQTVRRLYLYAISGIALIIGTIAALNLLGLALDVILRNVTGHHWVQEGPDWERERLSLYVPLLVISGAIWWFHWRLVERARHGENGDAERRSRIRAFYLTAVLAYSLFMTIPSLMWMLPVIFERIFGRTLEPFERNDIVTNLSAVTVVAGIWRFHWRTRLRDERDGPLTGVASGLPRFYRYAVCAVGAMLLVFGASMLISVAGKAIVGSGESGKWWDDPLASALSLMLAGGLYWGIHWTRGTRLLRGDAWSARSERASLLRPVYLVGLLVVAAVLTIVYFIDGIEQGLWELLDDTQTSGTSEKIREIAGPLVAAIPFIGLWLFHRTRLFGEARASGDAERPALMRRVYGYALGFVGLVFTALGLVALLWVVNLWIGGRAGSASLGMGGWRGQVALGTATLAAGALLWLWQGYQARRRMREDHEEEQASLPRRAYLFGALGFALIPLIVGLAVVLYQLLQRVLNVEGTGNLTEDLAWPIAIALVSTAGAAVHGVLLRRDLMARPLVTAPEAVAAPEAIPVPSRMTVVISGPAGANLPALLDELSARLPAGYEITPAGESRLNGQTGGAIEEAERVV